MLKLTETVDLVFRKEASRFSLDFWKSFSLAIVIHLLLLTVLRITTPPNLDRLKPLSPISVEIDLGSNESSEPENSEIVLSPIESLDPPQLLEMPMATPTLPSFTLHEVFNETPDFFEVEKIDYQILSTFKEEEEEE